MKKIHLILLLALGSVMMFSCSKSDDCDDMGSMRIIYDAKIPGNEGAVLDFYLNSGNKAATLSYGEEQTVKVDTDDYFVSAFTANGPVYENTVEVVKACKTTIHRVSAQLD